MKQDELPKTVVSDWFGRLRCVALNYSVVGTLSKIVLSTGDEGKLIRKLARKSMEPRSAVWCSTYQK